MVAANDNDKPTLHQLHHTLQRANRISRAFATLVDEISDQHDKRRHTILRVVHTETVEKHVERPMTVVNVTNDDNIVDSTQIVVVEHHETRSSGNPQMRSLTNDNRFVGVRADSDDRNIETVRPIGNNTGQHRMGRSEHRCHPGSQTGVELTLIVQQQLRMRRDEMRRSRGVGRYHESTDRNVEAYFFVHELYLHVGVDGINRERNSRRRNPPPIAQNVNADTVTFVHPTEGDNMNGPKTEFVGRLGKDPELRFSSNKGTPWVTFSVASDKVVGQPNPDGSRERKTTWIRVKAFNQLAENIAATLGKGAPVIVMGSLELETWTGNDGTPRTDLVCIADQVGLDLRRASATWTPPERSNSGGSQGGYANDGEYGISDDGANSTGGGAPSYGDDEPF